MAQCHETRYWVSADQSWGAGEPQIVRECFFSQASEGLVSWVAGSQLGRDQGQDLSLSLSEAELW